MARPNGFGGRNRISRSALSEGRRETSENHEETIMTKLIALLAATLLTVTAYAGDDKEHKDHSMKSSAMTVDSLDKNGDAQISKTEAAADKSLTDTFARADTNGAGYVAKTEFLA